MRPMGWSIVACVLLALALGACGAATPLPRACLDARTADVLRALQHAPRDVALQDGTRLSTCVERATGDVELQEVGATLTDAADRLARRLHASAAASVQLGFLIGAAERGAAHTPGVQTELAARIAGAAGLDGGPRRAALLHGRRAGRRRG
jgi:hypothetical protein